LKAKKEEMKEKFYKSLIDYEKQQMLLKDIDWMTEIKGRVLEREEQKRQYEAEKQRRAEERRKHQEEMERREDARKKREEEQR
jgi:hypothetical protein